MKKAIIITLSALAAIAAAVVAITCFGNRYIGEHEIEEDPYY